MVNITGHFRIHHHHRLHKRGFSSDVFSCDLKFQTFFCKSRTWTSSTFREHIQRGYPLPSSGKTAVGKCDTGTALFYRALQECEFSAESWVHIFCCNARRQTFWCRDEQSWCAWSWYQLIWNSCCICRKDGSQHYAHF